MGKGASGPVMGGSEKPRAVSSHCCAGQREPSRFSAEEKDNAIWFRKTGLEAVCGLGAMLGLEVGKTVRRLLPWSRREIRRTWTNRCEKESDEMRCPVTGDLSEGSKDEL